MAAAIEEGFPSGQRDQTVNLTAPPSKVRILLPPPHLSSVVRQSLVCCKLALPLNLAKI